MVWTHLTHMCTPTHTAHARVSLVLSVASNNDGNICWSLTLLFISSSSISLLPTTCWYWEENKEHRQIYSSSSWSLLQSYIVGETNINQIIAPLNEKSPFLRHSFQKHLACGLFIRAGTHKSETLLVSALEELMRRWRAWMWMFADDDALQTRCCARCFPGVRTLNLHYSPGR